jgi:hypothetical protein
MSGKRWDNQECSCFILRKQVLITKGSGKDRNTSSKLATVIWARSRTQTRNRPAVVGSSTERFRIDILRFALFSMNPVN